MDCDPKEFGASQEFWSRFGKKAYQNRIPAFGGIDLTARCNLQCLHCYINTPSMRARAVAELPVVRIHHLIDEITEAGCLFFLLTGGEPLLHRNFFEIYRHLKENGITVSVYTNGTMVADEHIALFQELPPRAIDISLYGATPQTYERVTQVPGSYEQCLAGIHRLLKGCVPLRLKTIVMELNKHELPEIRRMARGWGCEFRTNEALFPALDGDQTLLQWRIPPEEAVELEAMESATLDNWKSREHRPRKDTYPPDALYECTAGASAFHVSSDGYLLPCSSIRAPEYCFDLKQGTFFEGWNGPVSGIPKLKKPQNSPCYSCPVRSYCVYCPSKITKETGQAVTGAEYQCVLARQMCRRAKGMAS